MLGRLIRVLLGAAVAWSPALAQQIAFGPEFRVSTYAVPPLTRFVAPKVAVDPSGNFVVVWTNHSLDGSEYGVSGRRFDSAGGPLGGEFQVNTHAYDDQSRPTVAMDSSGGFVVVWDSFGQDGYHLGVFGQRFDSVGAALGGEFQVNMFTTGAQLAPAVAMDSSGNFVIVWSSGNVVVLGQRYDSAGVALGGEFQVNTSGKYPAVAMDSSGNFVVSWQAYLQDGYRWGVFGRRYDDAGAALGGEFQVNTYTTYSQTYPQVAVDPSGNFVVVWTSGFQDGSGDGVFGQRYDSAGAPIGGEFQVNTFSTGNQGEPAVAVDPSGDFVVVWTSRGQDGSLDGVFGRRYDSAGAPIGGEFQVNMFTPSNQGSPAVGADPSGNFVVVWSSLAVFARQSCTDTDTDSLCDAMDIIVTSPLDGAVLDCSNPKFVRPTIEWTAGSYDRYRVYLASDPAFAKGTRVTSGDSLLKLAAWTPSGKKWRNACNKALAADPNSPVLYVEVLGVDVDLPKSDSLRTTFSQVVQADVQP